MNPWPEWPRVCKTDYGQEEAIAVFGHDPRIYQTTVKEFLKDKKDLELSWKMLDGITIKIDKNKEKIVNLRKIEKEISQMKEGSIALVNQITTVSKIRIYDPKNLNGVLSGITLSQEQMEKINNKIKDLYIYFDIFITICVIFY